MTKWVWDEEMRMSLSVAYRLSPNSNNEQVARGSQLCSPYDQYQNDHMIPYISEPELVLMDLGIATMCNC